MTSFGEEEVTYNGMRIGRARVKRVYSYSTLYPSLAIDVAIALHQLSETSAPQVPPRNYEIRGLSGELRFVQNGEAFGAVRWADDRRNVRSNESFWENNVKLVCDLDGQRLEAIERKRNGKGPRFWLQLWPTAILAGGIIDLAILSFEFRIPIEDWTEVLKGMRRDGHEVVEVRFNPLLRATFESALGRTKAARELVDRGSNDLAAAECRQAIEALRIAVDLPDKAGTDQWKELFARSMQDRVAKEFAELLTNVKQLTNFAHHYREHSSESTRPDYSRVQAQSIIRMTEEVIAFVGYATSDKQEST
jgi:HEPN domain-containing protein